MTIKTFEGDFNVANRRFVIVAAKFNSFIVDQLVKGALATLKQHGVADENIDIVQVPGAFELPVVVKKVAASKRYDAVITVGAVIRGGTPHFDYVAGECVKGISSTALAYDIPVTFGVLTVDTIEQAIERAGTKAGNKGAEAAIAAIEMASLMQVLDA